MFFQDVIMTLERFWGSRGCVIVQPHDLMMGAGTFHPATVLRSLGPGAWRCAYAQPSRRPADARYGDNPNRMGHFYQYQVILKPSPIDVLDQYLASLKAIGIDLSRHDVRLVEDDWKSPTLGAWGIGWEVWLDGMEVTQFTYFQQVGGLDTVPVPAEITYGVERLAAQLQGKRSVYEVEWAAGVTYGDVFRRNEVEQSKLNFEHNDPEVLFAEFARHEGESRRLSGLGLALPAYDRCIMASHAFNLLDARGAISVAERQNYIDRIRQLAVACAQVWHDEVARHEPPAPAPEPPAIVPLADPRPTGSRELIVEIVCEELPPGSVRPMLDRLREGLLALIAGVAHGEVHTYATPRRLAVVVEGVDGSTPVVRKRITGPPADRAMADGAPTKAGVGFARGKGVDPEALFVVEGPKGPVVAVEIEQGGERTADLVAAGLDEVVRRVGSPKTVAKTMQWGCGGVVWPRPIHRVNALYDGVRIPAIAAGLPTGSETVGHRLRPEPFAFVDRQGWLDGLRRAWVEPDLAARQAAIEALLQQATAELGCDPIGAGPSGDDALIEEVLHLVEAPALVIGRFDPALLELPPRLLVQTMKQNQRYFPVWRGGKLSSEFVAISNNPGGDVQAVAAGNASVIAARFDDARFFLAEDRKRSLLEHGEKLSGVRWIKGLGTQAQQQARIRALAGSLCALTGADPDHVDRAGARCKCDLVTQMVFEFPELQGHVGRLYAAAEGEPEAVAVAIEEAWQPAGADDEVAKSPAGIALALADRMDAMVGCFGIGIVPKGGGDPQGLRRAATGLLRTVIDNRLRVDLRALFSDAVARFHDAVLADPDGFVAWTKARGTDPAPRDAETLVADLVAFCITRFKGSPLRRQRPRRRARRGLRGRAPRSPRAAGEGVGPRVARRRERLQGDHDGVQARAEHHPRPQLPPPAPRRADPRRRARAARRDRHGRGIHRPSRRRPRLPRRARADAEAAASHRRSVRRRHGGRARRERARRAHRPAHPGR